MTAPTQVLQPVTVAPNRTRLWIGLSLLATYIIWGSTYLAVRIGLESFPPFLMIGLRFVVAGGVLYGVLRWQGKPAPTRGQWGRAGIIGACLIAGGMALGFKRAGFYIDRIWRGSYNALPFNGSFDFGTNANNPLDTGHPYSNALSSVFASYTEASARPYTYYTSTNVEWFVQDNWKVHKRFTLDYGIRFYWIQPQYDEDLQTSNFLPERYNASNASLLYRPVCLNNAASCSGTSRRAVDPRVQQTSGFIATSSNTIDGAYVGRLVPGVGAITNGVVQAGAGIEPGLYRNRGVHFAPRFGFAYDLSGDQSLVIRGGGGMFYDRPQGNTVFDLVRNPPVTLEPTLFYGRMQDVGTGLTLLAPPSLVAIDRGGKVPTTYAFNLGVQYKLPFESVLDVSYVGTVGSHLLQRRNINAPAYGAAYLAQYQDPTSTANAAIPGNRALPLDFLRPYQGFGNIQYIEPASSSNYHSLQTSLNRRFSKGLLLGATYTWSKAMGTQANDLPGVNGFGAPHNLDQRRANYALQDFDRRHNFNLNWVYESPKLTDNRALGYVMNNWQLSGIYRFLSGQPYSIGFNIPGISAYTITGTQQLEGGRIVILKNPGSGYSSNPYQQFDVSAFTIPSAGSTSYESGRNYLNRAPVNSWDLSLAKRFKFLEKAEIEFRFDAFNAFNHTQFDAVNTTLNVTGFNSTTGLINATPANLASETGNPTGFGAVTSVRPPRNLQLSARFRF